jgi:hypothetical protein
LQRHQLPQRHINQQFLRLLFCNGGEDGHEE